ncbi:MAG: ParA family protein [Cyclobacteriaceae bacterium]
MSHTIAVYNFKGGVGKTSTTLNLALSWARSFRVLVIDCDPQANLTAALSNQNHHTSNLFTISKKLLHDGQPKIEPVEVSYYLHLIPGDYQMAALESNSQFISFGHIIFYKLLTSLKSNYDFILLDCPTHFGVTVKSFLANADSILIPAVPDSFSTSGFRKLLSHLNEVEKERPLNVLGIYFNLFRQNTLHHQKVKRLAEKNLGKLIIDQTVRESIRVSEAHAASESIYDQLELSPVANDFMLLSEEVIERLNSMSLDRIAEEHPIEDEHTNGTTVPDNARGLPQF